jgi:hypothetical protein
MHALALTLLLAVLQSTGASPAPSAGASAGAIGAPAAPQPPEGESIPRRMPYGVPQVEPGDVVIRNSGSTNAGGYTIVLHPDFSADVATSGGIERKTVGAAQAKWLFAKLDAAMPLGSLAVARCMKSASFGSTTTIAYRGQVTPDISCAGDAAVRELSRTVAVIVGQLDISPAIGRLRRRLL